jgi:hypothetical protein
MSTPDTRESRGGTPVQARSARTVYDELLVDAIDLHCHVDLEFSRHAFRKALPEWEWLPRAEAAGMRAVVLKSHLWPSVSLTPFLDQLYDGTVAVETSVTLNPTSGGLEPWAVEAAAAMGARAVFLPTWGSRNDRERGGFHRRLAETFPHFDPARLSTLSITDESGALVDAVHEILRLAIEHDLMLSTGHVSWRESLTLVREANRLGFDRLLFGHPLSGSVGAPAEAIREAAALGAYVEVCWPTVAPGRTAPAEVVGMVREIGAGRTVLTSDFFGGANPSPSDLLRMLLGVLFDAGLTREEIRQAVAVNPAALLGRSAPG